MADPISLTKGDRSLKPTISSTTYLSESRNSFGKLYHLDNRGRHNTCEVLPGKFVQLFLGTHTGFFTVWFTSLKWENHLQYRFYSHRSHFRIKARLKWLGTKVTPPMPACFRAQNAQGLRVISRSLASPICKEGQSERTFPVFAFSSQFYSSFSRFPLFFLIFPLFFPILANFSLPHWLRYWRLALNFHEIAPMSKYVYAKKWTAWATFGRFCSK